MFLCNSCKNRFDAPDVFSESHGAPLPYREATELCPICGSTNIEGLYSGYCRCCGRKIPKNREYCNETCRKAGEEMWLRQRQRQALKKSDPMYVTLAEIDQYNKENKTNLSYGQYIAIKGV